MKKVVLIFLSLIVLVFINPTVFADVKDERIIKIGGDYHYPPYEFIDSKGVYKGFNIDIMTSVAKEGGYKVELIPLRWEEALEALKNGEIDAVQGANKTKERQGSLLFSDSYIVNDQVIFTLKETAYISSLEDLTGKKVSIQKGDTGEEIAKEIKNINITYTCTQKEAIDLLIKGEVDAFIGNKTVGLYSVQKDDMLKKIKITGEVLNSVEYSLVTTQGNIELIDKFNKGLEKINEEGIYKEIHKKWFGEAVLYTEETWRKITAAIIAICAIISTIVGFILFINRKLNLKISERTRELEEVNQVITANERKYRKFIDDCPYAIFTHNMNDKILFVNNEGKRLLSTKSKKDIIGKDISEFLGDISYLHDIKSSNSRHSSAVYEKSIKRINGSSVYVEVRGSVIEYDGEECIYSIVNDISERKRLFEAIDYDRIKTEFFANISHELRTPLNVILASLQLMQRKIGNSSGDCELHDYINGSISNIKHNGQRLLKLVNNLIDITKIDSGYLSLNLKNGNIIDVIEDTVSAVVEYAEIKGISVVFDTEEEEVIMAYDEDKIERIMLNLLSNAVKFGRENGNIFVKAEVEDKRLLISVEDDGSGIPEDKINIIFERFRQVDESLTRSSEGSGIGLSLVKSLVEMLDGNITVKSELGTGSAFIVSLPINVISVNEESESRSLITNKDMVDIEFSDIT